jgi:hypothetical protein
VLIDIVKRPVTWQKRGDLSTIFDQLDAYAFSDRAVRLFAFYTHFLQNNAAPHRRAFKRVGLDI